MKKLLILFLGFIMSFSLLSCNKNVNDNSSKEEVSLNLKDYNVVDDNYRNYYQIFVHSFYDTNGDGIGDLNGVTKKLDYIKDLGFTGIWLMPINQSPTNHKYDTVDYYQVDKSYGTNDDLKNLIVECHKRDIKLILDLVLNHSSHLNKMFNKATSAYSKELKGLELTQEEKNYKDFYSFFRTKDDIPRGVKAEPILDFYYECNFSDNMPEFNCDSKYVREEFKNIIKFYLDMGIDGFRLDAVKYYYINSRQKNIEFLGFINDYAKSIKKDCYIVGECWDSYNTIQEYYKSGIDSFFNFDLSVDNPSSALVNSVNLNGKFVNRYYDALVTNDLINLGHISAPFLSNHDMPRHLRHKLEFNKFIYGLLQLLNGTTFTYYGEETGIAGNNRGNHDDSVRVPIKWGEENNHGDCKIPPHASKFEYLYGTVSEQEKDINSLLNYYKKILNIRNTNIEIARGKNNKIDLIKEEDKYVLVFSKEYNNNTIGIVLNFSDKCNASVDISKYGYKEIIDYAVMDFNEKVDTKNLNLNMSPYSIYIVK